MSGGVTQSTYFEKNESQPLALPKHELVRRFKPRVYAQTRKDALPPAFCVQPLQQHRRGNSETKLRECLDDRRSSGAAPSEGSSKHGPHHFLIQKANQGPCAPHHRRVSGNCLELSNPRARRRKFSPVYCYSVPIGGIAGGRFRACEVLFVSKENDTGGETPSSQTI